MFLEVIHDVETHSPFGETRQQQLVLAVEYNVNIIGISTSLYASPPHWKQDYLKVNGGHTT